MMSSIHEFAMPYFIGLVIDAISEEKLERVSTLCWQLALIIFGSSIFVGFRMVTFSNIGERIVESLRLDLFSEMIRKDIEFFDRSSTGELMSRLNADLEIIRFAMSTSITMAVRTSLIILSTFVIMLLINWQLTLITFTAVALISIVIKFYYKKNRQLTNRMSEEMKNMS